jgi:hypothetical protein
LLLGVLKNIKIRRKTMNGKVLLAFILGAISGAVIMSIKKDNEIQILLDEEARLFAEQDSDIEEDSEPQDNVVDFSTYAEEKKEESRIIPGDHLKPDLGDVSQVIKYNEMAAEYNETGQVKIEPDTDIDDSSDVEIIEMEDYYDGLNTVINENIQYYRQENILMDEEGKDVSSSKYELFGADIDELLGTFDDMPTSEDEAPLEFIFLYNKTLNKKFEIELNDSDCPAIGLTDEES